MISRLSLLTLVPLLFVLLPQIAAADCKSPFCQRFKRAAATSGEITDNDRTACQELRAEYGRACSGGSSGSHKKGEDEFCKAFQNVCIRLLSGEGEGGGGGERKESQLKTSPAISDELEPIGEEDHEATMTTKRPRPQRPRADFTDFCRQFKNRYLFVCPNPFRFGQKAVVFCPIYSERCHLPLPDKPVVPTQRPSRTRGGGGIERLCSGYRRFASMYCSNPIFLAQAQYRSACEKYARFCTNREG